MIRMSSSVLRSEWDRALTRWLSRGVEDCGVCGQQETAHSSTRMAVGFLDSDVRGCWILKSVHRPRLFSGEPKSRFSSSSSKWVGRGDTFWM
jgi:hypothetical protein